MSLTKSAKSAKRFVFALALLYGIVSMCIYLTPLILINYLCTFQMTTVATVHLVTGLLLGLLMVYGALDTAVARAMPDDDDDDDARASAALFVSREAATKFFDRAMLVMYAFFGVAIAVCVAIAFVAIALYLYNLFVILLVQCPNLAPLPDHNHTHHHHANTIDVIVSYRESGHNHILLLKHDVNERRIMQRSALYPSPDDDPPSDSGTTVGASRAGAAWMQAQTVHLAQTSQPVCSTTHYSGFFFLETEIVEAMRRRVTEAHSRKSLLVQQQQQQQQQQGQTSDVEDEVFIELFARTICRNEQGLVVMIIVFLFLVLVLNFVLMGWFLYMRSKYK